MSETLLPILDYWKTGGLLLIPIAGVCFGIWAYFFKARRALLGALALPPDFERRMEAGVVQGKTAELPAWLDAQTGVIPGAVACALRSRAGGQDPVAVFDDAAAFAVSRLTRDIVILAALAAVAPLIGLLGTVTGMIQTFQGVAATSAGTTGEVAAGIGQALVTTQVGLFVAIPGVLAVARLNRIVEEVRTAFDQCRNHLLALARHEKHPAIDTAGRGQPRPDVPGSMPCRSPA